jgi:hypothetical protein
MALDKKARGLLREALNKYFEREPFKRFLQDELNKRLDDLAPNTGFSEQLVFVIRVAHDDDWLDELVIKAASIHQGDRDLQLLKSSIEREKSILDAAISGDPYQAPWLAGGRTLVNRDVLRKNLKYMLEGYGPQGYGPHLFVVKGPRGSGRTHTRWYLEHLREKTKAFMFGLIDLKDLSDENPALPAYQLALSLDKTLQANFHFSAATDATFKIDPFVNQLSEYFEELAKKSKRHVIAIDGFGHVQPGPSCLRLIECLSVKIAEIKSKYSCFLVLLGFDAELPSSIGRNVYVEQLSSVEQNDIIDFCLRFYAEVLSKQNPTPEDVAFAVQHITTKARWDVNSSVETVGLAAADMCRELFDRFAI